MREIYEYLSSIAQAHAVSPVLFILIYVISTGPFLLVSGWLLHHIRRRRPLEVLVFLWALFYSAPYLYVLVAGRNLPVWVYVMVAGMMIGGLTLAARGLMRRIKGEPH